MQVISFAYLKVNTRCLLTSLGIIALYITAILKKINPQLTTGGFFCLAKWHISKLEGCYGIGVGYIPCEKY